MTPETRGGLELYRYTDCDRDQCLAFWTVDAAAVVLSVEVDPVGGPALIEEMDRSIRRLPPGWTTSGTDGTVVPDGD